MSPRIRMAALLAVVAFPASGAPGLREHGTEPPLPQIDRVSPSSGPPGTEVTIHGTYWLPVTSVLVGGVEARIERATGSEVVAVVGPHRPGRVSVEVRDGRGRSGVRGWAFRVLPTPTPSAPGSP